MSKINILILSIVMVLTAGCASIAGDNSKVVQVYSKPEGAKVYANNMPVGVTPTKISVTNTWAPTLLTLKKPGYEDAYAQVNTAFQPVGIFNVFFWPGFLVDAAAGNTMKVATNSRVINADLTRVV